MAEIDPYATTNALAGGYNFMAGIAQDRARRQAGNALASGNVDQAMSALGGAGDLQSVQALQSGQMEQEAAMREAQEDERKQILTFLGQGAEAMMQVPEAERGQIWMQLRPVLAQAGYPEEVLLQMDQSPKTDQNLMSVRVAAGQEIERAPTFNTSRGIVRETRPGAFENVFPIEPQAPSAPQGYRWTQSGDLEVIPGGPADPRVVSTRAAAGRAPSRPRASGGGRSSGGGSRAAAPSATAPAGRPWERFSR